MNDHGQSSPTTAGAFDDRVVVIFGAGPGLGRTLATLLAREGASTVLAARTAGTLEATAALVEAEAGTALVVPADVTDPKAVGAVFSSALERFGRVDAVVNSVLPPHTMIPVADLTDDDLDTWKSSIETSICGAMIVARSAAQAMIPRSNGAIVNVTATSALRGYANVSHHAAGKAGIHSLSQCLAAELGPFGIRVNCVAPGVIDGATVGHTLAAPPDGFDPSAFLAGQRARAALGKLATEEEVARAVMFLASSAASGITGQILTVDAGEHFH